MRRGQTLRRALISLGCSALCVLSAANVSAQQTDALRSLQLPVAPSPTKSGVSTPAKTREASPQVLAVVHHMSGWKLRTLLTPSDAPLASSFDENFVRTNIVAGYILADGRTVIARLPQAEAEMLNLSTAFRNLKLPATATPNDGGLLLVRPDGKQFGARFVGLDASTGLSLLETDQPLLLLVPASEVIPATPVVGQRVRVIAPVRAAIPVAAPTATVAARPADAPVGDEGVLYLNMSEEAGQLRAVKRSPSGMLMEVTAELNGISPEWAGGVALSETGNLVGIIEESDARATRLLSAETVRGAARRVRSRRASVPQPWLGARGDALAFAPLEQLLALGWPREQARSLLSQQQQQRGVLLTSVAPGTPAAHAGLRPGDVVSRIGQHEVRSIEDMSLLLKELGGNTLANFTVLRAQSVPLNLAVRLSESPSPGLDTARAELRAAHSELRAKKSLIKHLQENVRRSETALRLFENEQQQRHQSSQPKAAPTTQLQEEFKRMQQQFHLAREQAQKISADYDLMRTRVVEAEARYRAASEAYQGLAVKPLLSFGLEAVRISPAAGTKLSGARQSGLLVMSVQPDSTAAQSKIQVGDMIEAINGQYFSEANWNINFSTDYDTELSLGILRHGEKISFKLSRQNSPQ